MYLQSIKIPTLTSIAVNHQAGDVPVSKKNITELDDLSILQIFYYIQNIREKIRLKRVCRRFQFIATLSLRIHHKWIRTRNDVYYEREMRLFARNERKVRFPFDKILRNCPNLCELDTTAFNRICWNPPRLPKELYFEKLTLMGWCNVNMARVIIQRSKNLKLLEIGCLKMNRNYTDYKIDLTHITSCLVTLKLRGIHYDVENIKTFLSQKGSHLEAFYYSSYVTSAVANCDRYFFTVLIQYLYEYCSHLKEIELRLVQANYFASSLVLKTLFSLERLVIMTEQRNFTIEMLEILIQNSPNLRQVFIFSHHIREEDLYRICRKYCPAIRECKSLLFSWDVVIENNLLKR